MTILRKIVVQFKYSKISEKLPRGEKFKNKTASKKPEIVIAPNAENLNIRSILFESRPYKKTDA
jgi:hypothetical protein